MDTLGDEEGPPDISRGGREELDIGTLPTKVDVGRPRRSRTLPRTYMESNVLARFNLASYSAGDGEPPSRPVRPSRRRWMKYEDTMRRFCAEQGIQAWSELALNRTAWLDRKIDFVK